MRPLHNVGTRGVKQQSGNVDDQLVWIAGYVGVDFRRLSAFW
jgi:hypothetical protein